VFYKDHGFELYELSNEKRIFFEDAIEKIKFIRQEKIPIPKISELGFYIFRRIDSYFNPAKLCSIVAILANASASFCLSFASTFSGAPFTNFSFESLF
jgi:hypothetical protein